MELRDLEWMGLLHLAEAGERAPLAAALRAADPADVPRDVLAFAADAMTGRTASRKRGRKAISDDLKMRAQLAYMVLIASGKARQFAADIVAHRADLSRSAAYDLLAPVGKRTRLADLGKLHPD